MFFDSLSYAGKPSLASLGLRPIHIIDRNPDQTTPPNQAGVTAAVTTISATDPYPVVCFDIETPSYPSDIRSATPAQVDATIAYFTNLIAWTKAVNPNARVGFYGAFPIFDYWTPNMYNVTVSRPWSSYWYPQTQAKLDAFRAWQAANDYWIPFAAQVDFIFPSLYTYYMYENDGSTANYHGWKDAAILTIAEARKYGKPVVPFIWPQNHNAPNAYLAPDYWAKELAFLRDNADGAVLWGSSSILHDTWVLDAPWWLATVKFLKNQ